MPADEASTYAPPPDGDLGVVCGSCGGPIFFLTCGQGGCSWVIASECQSCGALHPVAHPDEPCNTENADA